MRVLIVNTFYYPHMQGGAEQSVKLLAEGLVERGHEVGIYSIDRGDEVPCTVATGYLNGVKVFRCGGGRFKLYRFSYHKDETSKAWKVRQKYYCYFNPDIEKSFVKVIKEFHPDIIHTNSLNGIPWLIWNIGQQFGSRVVHTIRDRFPITPYTYGHKENKLVVAFHHAYTRYYSRLVDSVTAPSHYTLSTSIETGCFKGAEKDKIFNAVKVNREAMLSCMKNKAMRTDPTIRFMYAGRLIESKGIVHMLDAFNKMPKQCELHICGAGELEELVKKEQEKDCRVYYHGNLNPAALDSMYDYCDVLLVPSCWPEPFGRVVIEGNCHAMPVIAGHVGGIPEILQVTHGGATYSPADSEELARKMLSYLDRKAIVDVFDGIYSGIVAFDLERQITSFENLYQKTVFRREAK